MLHEPSLKMKELWGVRNGLAKPGVQPILSKAICSVLLCVRSSMLCNMLGKSRMCVSYAREISPTLILIPVLFDKEKQKWKKTRALPVENTREP